MASKEEDSDIEIKKVDLVRRKKIIYELGADGTCEFENGESLRISRTLLAIHSQFFMETFFGSESKTKIKIKGFDRASFKTFLDCLFGMKEYTLRDALLIYPIAHRYEVKESLDKCSAVLKPEDMSENVSRVLTLTTFYKSKEIIDYVIDLIKTEYGIVNFLENKEYCCLLEPCAILELIENVDYWNSLVWTIVYQWGENYLKQCGKSDIKSFFIEHGILEKISLTHFESAKALTNFHAMSNKQLLNSDEILCHLETNTLGLKKNIPDRSSWVKINKGDSFFETMVPIRNLMFYSSTKTEQLDLTILISPNKILIEPKNSISSALKVKARYIFRSILRAANANCDKTVTRPVWRSDLNFFYLEKFDPSFRILDYLHTPFSQSNEFHVDLIDGDIKMPLYKSCIHAPVPNLEIPSVEITYSFNCPCRILKTSFDANKDFVGENNLYFTKKISISGVREE